MRIFVDARVLLSNRPGGVTGYARLMLKHLLEAGGEHNFVFFTNNFKKINFSQSAFNQPRVQFLNLGLPNRLLDLTNCFFNRPKIDKLAKADIFYNPHFNILSFKDFSKYIPTVHDLSFFHFPDFFSWRQKLWHQRQRIKNRLKAAGKIIAVSDFTAQDAIEKFGLPPGKVARIYAGVNPFYGRLRPDNPGLAEFRNQKEINQPFLLSIGVLEPRKNTVGLIKAFNLLKTKPAFKDLALIIAGPRGWLYEKIFEEARRSPVRKDIIFWGRATDEELRYLYNLAEVFVYPSFFEGFGFPPLEAQACGLPAVVSNRSSLPEIFGDSALMVDPWRTDELAMAIEAILTEDKLRQDLVIKGLTNVKRFNWQKTAGEILNLFERSLE